MRKAAEKAAQLWDATVVYQVERTAYDLAQEVGIIPRTYGICAEPEPGSRQAELFYLVRVEFGHRLSPPSTALRMLD